MFRLGMIIWSVVAPVLMGISALVVLTVPAFGANEKTALPAAVAIGVALAIPVTYVLTKKIYNLTRG